MGVIILLLLISFHVSDLTKGQKEIIKILKSTTQPASRPSKP